MDSVVAIVDPESVGKRRVVRALQDAYRQKLIRRPFRSNFLQLVADTHRSHAVRTRLKKHHQTTALRRAAREAARKIDASVHRPDIFRRLNITLGNEDEVQAIGFVLQPP